MSVKVIQEYNKYDTTILCRTQASQSIWRAMKAHILLTTKKK